MLPLVVRGAAMKQASRLTVFCSDLVTIGNEGREVSLVLWCAQRPAQLDEGQAAIYLAPGLSINPNTKY